MTTDDATRLAAMIVGLRHNARSMLWEPTRQRWMAEADALERLLAALARLQAENTRYHADLMAENVAKLQAEADVVRLQAERDEALQALRKVRAHTSYTPAATIELLRGLLASVERIADAALSGGKTDE
jgi:hypothetical protein